ncbi:acyl carrier protein [Fontibacillus panacisegetis]|uniref:Acyl carrier protein n=1 Tax=Fontibacillus panacisegetis TaxID=670482 RepID=A0A1G7PYU2_9BACL|nr:acyl carrier protein [Fontibacillus panacisegetis]SDF91472.1 acyl carrier protein [Fontibacillus panacisegetis]
MLEINIEDKLKELSNLGNKYNLVINNQTELIRDLGIDSLTIVAFISFLEENGIMVPDEDLNAEYFSTVGAVKAYVEHRKDSKKG